MIKIQPNDIKKLDEEDIIEQIVDDFFKGKYDEFFFLIENK
ncbi:MAG: hypothetical protein QXO40_00020 [Candidatus Aenigmatarchaeota archaeon]